jgi:hypothetical protein
MVKVFEMRYIGESDDYFTNDKVYYVRTAKSGVLMARCDLDYWIEVKNFKLSILNDMFKVSFVEVNSYYVDGHKDANALR